MIYLIYFNIFRRESSKEEGEGSKKEGRKKREKGRKRMKFFFKTFTQINEYYPSEYKVTMIQVLKIQKTS